MKQMIEGKERKGGNGYGERINSEKYDEMRDKMGK